MMPVSRLIKVLVSLLFAVQLIGCSVLQPASPGLTVLAGSELKDLEPMLAQIQRDTGIKLVMQYTGTLDGAEKIMAGDQVDFAWFSHAKYLNLLQGAQGHLLDQQKIMLSPVVLGVRESKAKAWGWVDNPNLTWRDVLEKAGNGDLKYAMTNPAASNSGFSALVGVASALSGKSDALQSSDIDQVSGDLKTFFKGQALTAGSSGWLADQYVLDQDRLDGMINYESVLLGLNKGGKLKEPLYLVYPKEGIITADYPLILVNPNQREAYNKLVDYLRSAAVQKQIMTTTLRRPINPQVQLSQDFPNHMLVELPFPSTQDVVDRLLFSYIDQEIKPSHTYYVLDVSGSMQGSRLDSLKKAMDNLAGSDSSLTGQFARFRNREKVSIITFNSAVAGRSNFDIDISQPASLQAVRDYVDSLSAGGNTAIYSALQEAYKQAAQDRQNEPDRVYSIVLMTDGENNSGISSDDFFSYLKSAQDVDNIRTFTIQFGEADQQALQSIATATGGQIFDASHDPLPFIFKEIRGYQ
jgi:Ca-activated chloride channel homolog